MFLSRAIAKASSRNPLAAGSVGMYDLVDARSGQLLTGGTQTDTGTNVTPEYALGFHAWYRATTLISQKSAAVPKLVMRRKRGKIGAEVDDAHPVRLLIGVRANEEQTAFQFWLQMAGHLTTRGNAYAYLWRDSRTKEVKELIPLDPDHTKAYRHNGKLWYKCFPFGEEGAGYTEKAENVLHFKGIGFDGLSGYPLWELAANEINLGRAQRKLEAMRYKNSGRPSMVLETEKSFNLPTKIRIRDDWERMQAGLENAGKTALLDRGIKARAISMNAEEMGASAAGAMSLSAISNYTGVPVSKLGGARNASSEQDDRAFITDGLDPYLNILDDEVQAKLLTLEEAGSGLSIVSDREALLRPDLKTKYDILRIATAGRAYMTPNEARDEIDLPASDEKDADKLLTPLNMGKGGPKNQPADNADNGPGRPEDDTGNADKGANAVNADQVAQAREAARYALSHATTHMVKRIGAQASRAAKSASGYAVFIGTLAALNRRVFLSQFAPAERICAAVNGDGQPGDGAVARHVLDAITEEYKALSENVPLSLLPDRVSALAREQMLRLPQTVVGLFVNPEEDET